MSAALSPAPDRDGERAAVAFLSLHASPLARLGQRENGGLNVYVRAVCEELGARGIETDIFVRRISESEPVERPLGPRGRVVALDAGPLRRLPKHQLPGTRSAFLAAVREYIDRRHRRYRAVHSHYWLTGDVAQALAEEMDVPWLHTAHTLAAVKREHGFDGDVPERLIGEHRIVAAGARLVVNTRAEASDLGRLYGARSDQCLVAPPGVDLVRFQPRETGTLRQRLGLSDRLVAMFAGRLEPLKGPETLVEAVACLAEAGEAGISERIHGLFAGDVSSEGARVGQRRELAAQAARLGVEQRISFLGALSQDRLALLYALADVVVVPSHTESFGLVALEAQACGTPVVAAAVGGLRDIVVPGRTGYLVDGHDPQAYAEAIAATVRAPGERRRLQRAARQRAEGFTWERTVDILAAEYGLEPPTAVAAGRGA